MPDLEQTKLVFTFGLRLRFMFQKRIGLPLREKMTLSCNSNDDFAIVAHAFQKVVISHLVIAILVTNVQFDGNRFPEHCFHALLFSFRL